MIEWMINDRMDERMSGWMGCSTVILPSKSDSIFEIRHFEQKIGNLGWNILFYFNWMDERMDGMLSSLSFHPNL
jgi:hypothetical protein